ncbi:MAG: D-glycero-beta-D-manno-heptose 1,7-bisphosphate 7-phosphatase [Pseudodesulfovibrio sp.]|uniref:D,D-heptose 1,7-bisphosphate phosphatase n=1 Tax=Pseudodesulfovibrio aespoeensis (strain ATCC 700646 / DSM 10631 / Aspo-2) TaxID=643562 RepID=E6VTD0_PSEA9|nr:MULTISPECIES: D-glycero-beta-D-manno-heptose 1,7-bisphosphate 7-phosphatase [Pseudodesulfovibrio]MBU4193206.1 D-glycero-beta-D-manno-heptose 1,7-bisphosphate 7-phosphatase [Pseudomonadota bacterium]ADU63289.1 histidinol-phosphate phosphatase family protein [Pseudodesulfovibrio aespoeensis Aspo-2]MBU4245343.1 D-glycero-beta-D-manno-heptose 1,7-bisphosphate 7-phosphatase [Pseudomonadota bacterium]MBU4378155.1 D-glycero-beta-D-manno-heptose 1,7-bisphosphate 7-phosphatase [Pseudomonadota bacteri
MAGRYVLLDRDGTIIFDRHYLHDPAGVELLPGAAQGMRRMRELGWGLAVLTNQSGVGRGYYDEASVLACNARMAELLLAQGVRLDGIFFCPHEPEAACGCRKPAPGLMEQAARSLGFDPHESVMIGDKDVDMLLGRAVGAATILVRTGKGGEHEARCRDSADFVADDLLQAADILATLG